MARYHFAMWAFGTSLMSIAVTRPGLRGAAPEIFALMLRMTLPIAPKLSDMLAAMQAGEHWHDLLTSVMA